MTSDDFQPVFFFQELLAPRALHSKSQSCVRKHKPIMAFSRSAVHVKLALQHFCSAQ